MSIQRDLSFFRIVFLKIPETGNIIRAHRSLVVGNVEAALIALIRSLGESFSSMVSLTIRQISNLPGEGLLDSCRDDPVCSLTIVTHNWLYAYVDQNDTFCVHALMYNHEKTANLCGIFCPNSHSQNLTFLWNMTGIDSRSYIRVISADSCKMVR